MNISKLSIKKMNKRKKDFEKGVPLRGINIRKHIHFLPLILIKADRMASKEKVLILHDRRKALDRPVIFACTHIGGNDIQRIFEAIEKHAYLFLGDPGKLYTGVIGALLYLNGVICLETRNRQDRFIAKRRAIELIKRGGYLLIFPEGAWNISPHMPVMDLFNGTMSIACETDTPVVPIAIERYENTYVVNIGEEINPTKNKTDINMTEILRDILATLRWEIWEANGIQPRESIKEQSAMTFVQALFNDSDYDYDINDALETRYIRKDTPDDSWVCEIKEGFII